MARRKITDRREPYFEDPDGDLRASPEDRPGFFTWGRRGAKRRIEPEWDTADGRPPERRGKAKSSKSKRGGKPPREKRSLLRKLAYWTLVLGIWGALAIAGVLGWYIVHMPELSTLQVPERPPNIAILGSDGTLLVNRGARGQAVKLEDMPKYLPQAVIAIEDRHFYYHFGFDPTGLLRAVARNLRAGGVAEGGSTITQQLAKNLFLTPERSLERKIQELILSIWLETKFSKHDILEMYLNRVYLGAGTYGVEAASQRYFGKPVHDISLQEAAILAGLLKAPSRYAPTRSIEAALTRARTVLDAMVEAGFITQGVADKAAAQKLSPAKTSSATAAVNYAADWIMDLLPGFIETVDSDISIETTLDPKVQTAAENALRESLDKDGKKYNVSQGALVVMSPSGAVEALVGGRSYQDSQYNRAVVAKRQPGSAFKPFVFLTALEKGLTPDDQREDAPLNIKGWRPENYTHEYHGFVPLREALALSLNTVAVRLGLEVGPSAIIKTAQRLGVTSPLQANASIALGTSEVTPLELTRAYAPFANGGNSVVPFIVTRIRDSSGRVIFEREPPRAGVERVIRADRLSEMNEMLSGVVGSGTARHATLGAWPIAGKTGTSQDYRDAWFIGYSAHMLAGVWVGNDDGTPSKHATGSTLPIEIWNRVMASAHIGVPVMALPGAGAPAKPPSPLEPTIDDILIGGWTGEEERGQAQPPPQPKHRDCPLDSGFLDCVFSR